MRKPGLLLGLEDLEPERPGLQCLPAPPRLLEVLVSRLELLPPHLLKRFPVDVSDLDWTPDGLVVAARVYVDGDDAGMAATAARDEEIEKRGGGLDAHLFKRLPVREWDRWLDAKFAHPFLQLLSLFLVLGIWGRGEVQVAS